MLQSLIPHIHLYFKTNLPFIMYAILRKRETECLIKSDFISRKVSVIKRKLRGFFPDLHFRILFEPLCL